MEIVEMVLGGRVNKSLVSLIEQNGGHAIGLSGKDGGLLKARQVWAMLWVVSMCVRVSCVDVRVALRVMSQEGVCDTMHTHISCCMQETGLLHGGHGYEHELMISSSPFECCAFSVLKMHGSLFWKYAHKLERP